MIPVIAGNLKHRPIEVLGIGSAACEATTPHFEVRATEEAVRQAYELTGLSGDDLDLFYAKISSSRPILYPQRLRDISLR